MLQPLQSLLALQIQLPLFPLALQFQLLALPQVLVLRLLLTSRPSDSDMMGEIDHRCWMWIWHSFWLFSEITSARGSVLQLGVFSLAFGLFSCKSNSAILASLMSFLMFLFLIQLILSICELFSSVSTTDIFLLDSYTNSIPCILIALNSWAVKTKWICQPSVIMEKWQERDYGDHLVQLPCFIVRKSKPRGVKWLAWVR